MKRSKVSNITERKGPAAAPRAVNVRLPPGALVRLVVFAILAVVASAWAIWRHYTVPTRPMLVPVPSANASDAGEHEHAHEIDIEP